MDPACGSGAYLLGMMQELIELQVRLFNVTQDAKSLYDLKLEIIQRNLYGVDIDDFAVNIAMLRLWLSLAIDYEGDDAGAAAQPGLQGGLRRQPAWPRPQQRRRGAGGPGPGCGAGASAGPAQGRVPTGVQRRG